MAEEKLRNAVLVLSDGSIFRGLGFGAERSAVGELVFTTSMTGYQETLTDPSYGGQIVIQTYPLIGNYGIGKQVFESSRIQASGYVVREACEMPSHKDSVETLDAYLGRSGVPGIAGIDTRSIVRRIRSRGVMPACIAVYSGKEPDIAQLVSKAKALDYSKINFVEKASVAKVERYGKGEKKIVLLDCGVKMSIIREMNARGVSVIAMPYDSTPEAILAQKPAGLLISNGPGDPAVMGGVARNVRSLFGKLPIFGICLGHQLLAHAAGGKTFKLKFGHRGANHPVKELASGKVTITSQNHGYAVDEKSLPGEFEVTHINLNDGTVEGMRHKELPIFSVQYHPEANPGPLDSLPLFDRFVSMLK